MRRLKIRSKQDNKFWRNGKNSIALKPASPIETGVIKVGNQGPGFGDLFFDLARE
jgi:hypothetical protein